MKSISRFLATAALAACTQAGTIDSALAGEWGKHGVRGHVVRFATYNASLNRFNDGELVENLSTPDNTQTQAVAEIIQRVRPDILLINEFDFDANGTAAALFQQNYLSVSQHGATPIAYPYVFSAPSNTGTPSGFDLDNDGTVGADVGTAAYANDSFGFGFFPGQYGMLVLSQYPIDKRKIRTFQKFLWKDMPGALLPDDPATPEPADWYSPEELDVFRLSSKSHWDVPVKIGHSEVHVLVSHPTPPVFDGEEDRNGTRNHDEIRFWADYVTPLGGRYIYDDKGRYGGLPFGVPFVIMGDQNSDPYDGDSIPGSTQQLLGLWNVNTWKTPTSDGAVEASAEQGGINASHVGDPVYDTGDFDDTAPGNLRVDYVLPSWQIGIKDSGVFWPTAGDPYAALITASDHRLVWVDAIVPSASSRFYSRR
jgi:Endonuclease/Exonuclease/phosphatase family